MHRLGKPSKPDAATSRNLASMIQSREFREDLHCRLFWLNLTRAEAIRSRAETGRDKQPLLQAMS
jgi:transcriptional regulator with PAS, ATPase and Fis domain